MQSNAHETLVATLTYLLAALSPLRLRIKRLYLERGFFSVPVIRWLKALNLPFVMPAIIRGKQGGTRQLLKGRKSYFTVYTLSGSYGAVECNMGVVCRYQRGQRGRHGIQHLLYVMHGIKLSLSTLHHDYRFRFGIETSYRIKNHCRIRTTTKNPVVRLLFVALAFVLVNLWVCLLWRFVSRSGSGAPKRLSPFIPTQDDVRVPSPGGRAPFSSGSSHFLTFNRLNLSIY